MNIIQKMSAKMPLVAILYITFSSSYAAELLVPELIAPASQSKVTKDESITYEWKPVTGASRYFFSIDDLQLREPIHRVWFDSDKHCDAEGCAYTPPETAVLGEFGRYAWRVRAINRPIRSPVGRRVFYVSGEAPEQPAIVAPTDKTEHELPDAMSFEWSHSEGAAHYIFRVVDKTLKTVIYRDAKILASACDDQGNCVYEPTEALELVPGSYLWTVSASNGFDRSSVARSDFTVKAAVPQGTLANGYDWELPAYASQNTRGGLVRDTWANKEPYTNSAFYSIRWDQVPLDEDGNYDFGSFNWWLGSGGGKEDNVIVRLEVNSVCETPTAFLQQFNYYAGGSIAFWEDIYIEKLTGFLTAFGTQFAGNTQIKGVHLGIADGEYSNITDGGNIIVDGKAVYDETINYGKSLSPEAALDYKANICGDFYDNDAGWGEFWVTENQLSHAMEVGLSQEKFLSSVTSIINAYTTAFGENTPKLALTNLEGFVYNDPDVETVKDDVIQGFNDIKTLGVTPEALKMGVGNRDGLVEDWMAYSNPVYGVGFKPGAANACYMTMDESFAETIAGRYWGTENEEYGDEQWVTAKFGNYENQPYRFMLSSLRALQMRRNHMFINTPAMVTLAALEDPTAIHYNTTDFLSYVASTMGRDKTDTPDAFVVLGERYIRTSYITGFSDEHFASEALASCLVSDADSKPSYAQVREYGRWLTEVSGQGEKSKLMVLTQGVEPWSIPAYLPEVDGETKYEYAARSSHELKFDINDAVIAERCDAVVGCELVVKVVFEDSVATTLSLVTESGVVGRVQTVGDETTKTVTFALNGVFANSYENADFGLRTTSETEVLPVFMARVNFMRQ